MGFGIPAFAVDTHVLRVANRIGYARSDNPDVVESCLTGVIPPSDWMTGTCCSSPTVERCAGARSAVRPVSGHRALRFWR